MHDLSRTLSLGVAASLALFALPSPAFAVQPPDIAELRASGPEALEELLSQYDQTPPANRDELAAVIDAVAGQRYATVSRLYWFTDLDRAEAEARRLHRPILALRMLGDLRSDLSCANSRLFRATLYANAEISAFLRSHFVLYWSSERAVPVVTIDYGDGRKLVRTTTGNSAHYVLDESGHVLDVLPGLYAPAVFRKELTASLALADRVRGMTDAERVAATVAYHRDALATTARDWQRASDVAYLRGRPFLLDTGALASAAARAQLATMSKAAIEVPDLERIGVIEPGQVPRDDAAWSAIGQRVWNIGAPDQAVVEYGRLRPRSRFPAAEPAAKPARLPVPKPIVLDAASRALVAALHNAGPDELRATPDELARVIAQLEQHIVADTALNQFTLRQTIHGYIAGAADTRFATLNAWIYDQVFATPRSDAWLGLLPRSDFTGVPGDGVVMR